MMDAAACGLPIVANNTMIAPERLQGNGAAYKLNDLEDLVRVLLGLRDMEIRKRLGAIGAQKMAHDFSWESIAKRRLRDYEGALSSKVRREEDLVLERKSLAKGSAVGDAKRSPAANLSERTMSDL